MQTLFDEMGDAWNEIYQYDNFVQALDKHSIDSAELSEGCVALMECLGDAVNDKLQFMLASTIGVAIGIRLMQRRIDAMDADLKAIGDLDERSDV